MARRFGFYGDGISFWVVSGQSFWLRVLAAGARIAQPRWMPERRILGGGWTRGIPFWPFLNSSCWWWLISSMFLTRTSCHKITRTNGYHGSWRGWVVSASGFPLTALTGKFASLGSIMSAWPKLEPCFQNLLPCEVKGQSEPKRTLSGFGRWQWSSRHSYQKMVIVINGDRWTTRCLVGPGLACSPTLYPSYPTDQWPLWPYGQAPLFMGFSRQEHWNGLPCPFQVHLFDPWRQEFHKLPWSPPAGCQLKMMYNLRVESKVLFGAKWGLQPGKQHLR